MSPNPRAKNRSSSQSLLRPNSTGGALRRGEIKISEPIPIPREGDGFGPQALPPQNDTRTQRTTLATSDSNGVYQQVSEPTGSSFNTTASLSTGPSKSSLGKQRGGLRGTLKKLFGNKKKRETIGSITEEPSRSEVLSFITRADSAVQNVQPRRISSMPLQEVNRYSALGSHDPRMFDGPEAFGDARVPRDSFTIGYHHKRRNTLSDSRSMVPSEPTEAPISYKRRSRSANQLRDIAQQWRNRDDEIQYWRRSIMEDPLPTYTESRPTTRENEVQPDTADVAEPVRSVHTAEDVDKSIHVMPSQTFDFGNLMGHNPEDSVEQRLTTLEVKIVDLELALARLSDNDIGRPTVLDKPPSPTKSLQVSHKASFKSEKSSISAVSHQAAWAPSPEPSGVPKESASPATERNHRSSAATTLRPNTAVRRSAEPRQQSPAHSPVQPLYATLEHIEKLMILIQREQANRHKLELHCKTLENQLDLLQRSPPYSHFKAHLYPTPSPDEPSFGAVRKPSAGGSFSSNLRPSEPRSEFRDDSSIESRTTDDGYPDAYETPTEIKENSSILDQIRVQKPVGGMF